MDARKKGEDMTAPSMCVLGLSSDWRTNRWQITCACGQSFTPVTVMAACQSVTCPYCDRDYYCKYNDNEIIEV